MNSGGRMLYPGELDELKTLIENSGSAKPVMREITTTRSIIHLKWIFFVLLGLLGMEWFVRKFNGGY
jgi:hypothetical protein